MLQRLFRTKSLEQLTSAADEPGRGLKRQLTAFQLTMLGIGAIVGAGIFSTIGTAAAGNLIDGRLGAGPALMVSFLLTAIACAFTALCYAELASMIPISGSAYTYTYATLGELMAWIIGWDLLLEYAVSNVAVAISWADYARSFLANVLGIHVPGWLARDPITALSLAEGVAPMSLGEKLAALEQARAGGLDGASVFTHWEALSSAPLIGGFPLTFNLLAVLVTIGITWLCYRGIRETAGANTGMVVVKILILLVVVIFGISFINADNWTPFAPNGMKGIQAGAAIIFFAFIGFDAVSTTAEETRDPGRDMPRGILWSLAICTVLYIAVTAVVTGMVSSGELAGHADPLSYVFEKYELHALAGVVAFGAVVATTTALLVYQVGQPRIFLAMARDGLLNKWFTKVHPRHGTPSNATIFTGFIVAVPAGLLNIDVVVELTNIGTLFAFGLVCIAVVILRLRRPEAERRFRVPAVGLIAPLGVASCVWLALGLPSHTWVRFVLWLAAGLIFYFIYGYWKSRLRDAAPQSGA